MARGLDKDDLMFFVDFDCTGDSNNSLGCKTIHFSSCSPPTTVKDIKTKIEETHRVPGMMVTRLKLNCVVLHDEDSLDGLNLRRGDTFSVQYYSKVNCSEVSRCVRWIAGLLSLLEKWRDDNGSVDVDKDIKGESCLEELSFTHFSPWMTPEKDANKYYFISKGGLKLVTRIVDILLDHPPTSLPWKLLAIESKTLGILWNISVDEHILKAVVHAGGVETCLRGLMRIQLEETGGAIPAMWGEMYQNAIKETMRKSLGALSNLCELEDVRLTIASNKEAIKQMLSICSSPFFERSIIHQVIMIFLDLSYTHTTHQHLIQNDKFTAMVHMSWQTQYDETYILMKFHYNILFSILLLVSSQYFSPLDVKFLQYFLGIFANKMNHTALATIEEMRGIYWGTVAPLVIALYQNCSKTVSNFIPPCKMTILMALLSLLRREYHCKVLVKEGMVDFCICLPWYTQGEVQTRAVTLVSMMKNSPNIVYQPPSLLNMCKAAVAVHHDCGLSCVINSTVPELAGKLWIND